MTDLTLNNGLKLPALGIAIAEGPREDYGIPAALRAGFRHLDLSAKNLNYENVGDVLQWCFEENLAQRKNLFITANFNHSDYERTVLDWRIQKMLIDLNLDYLDMILIEKPIDFKKQEEVFQYPKDLAFELLLDSIRSDLHDKRVLSICYDNFTKNQLAHVIKLTSSLQMSRPQANRLDVTPYFQEKEIREFCRHENIQVMSHHIEIGQLRPIIDGADGRMAPVLEIEEIMRIATELNIKPSQAIIKWIIDSGISLVVRNGSRKRLHLLQDCLKIPLTSEDVQVIRDLDIQKYSKQFCISEELCSGPTLPTFHTASGRNIPALGIAFWHHVKEAPHRDEALAMECALDAGIRNFDCGQIFKSQKTIGKVIGKYIQSGKLQRKDLFLSSKVWNTHHSFDKCIEAVEICLQELRVTYLDLMLIHYPMATQICELPNFMQTYEAATDIDYLETYRALERCVQLGKVREIGVCNFNEAQTNRILENAVILPSVCQSELSVKFKMNLPILNLCHRRRIIFQAAWPFGRETSRDVPLENVDFDSHVKRVANEMGRTPRQIALRWLFQKGCVVYPRGYHMAEFLSYLEMFKFELTEQQMQFLDATHESYPTFNDGVHLTRHAHWPHDYTELQKIIKKQKKRLCFFEVKN